MHGSQVTLPERKAELIPSLELIISSVQELSIVHNQVCVKDFYE